MDKDIFSPEEELDDDAFLASLEDLLKEPEETAKPQQEEPPKPQPEKKHNRNMKWEKALVCGVLALAVAGGGIFAFLTLKDPYRRKILPGVTVGGVDLSDMGKSQAKKALEAEFTLPLSQEGFTVTFPDPKDGLPETLALPQVVTLDCASAAEAAYAIGRTAASDVRALPLEGYLSLDEAALQTQVEAFSDSLAAGITPHTAGLEGEKPDLTNPDALPQTLVITPSRAGLTIEEDVLCQDVADAIRKGELQCTYTGKFEETLPDDPDLQALYDANCYPAQEPSIDKTTLEVTPGKPGYVFDVEQVREQMAAMGQETLRIPLEILQPTTSNEDVYFQDVLGHCETPHGDNEKRNTNLRLACKALDGLILQPGQEFSYNDTLGERTAEKGYQPAPAYSGTTLVDSLGGGICQVSSTLYLASVYAELTILERVNHGYPVHYIPYGMDATVNWGFTDLKMRNDSDLPVKIHAEESDGYVRVEILGTETRNYDIEMSYSVGGRYVKTFMTKKDKETGEVISKEPVALSAYMEDVFQ